MEIKATIRELFDKGLWEEYRAFLQEHMFMLLMRGFRVY